MTRLQKLSATEQLADLLTWSGRLIEGNDRVLLELDQIMPKKSFRDVYRQKPIDSKDYVMPFGKYKGKTIKEVIEGWCDAQYLVWLHENSDGFELSANLLEECEGYEYPAGGDEFWKD